MANLKLGGAGQSPRSSSAPKMGRRSTRCLAASFAQVRPRGVALSTWWCSNVELMLPHFPGRGLHRDDACLAGVFRL